VPVSPYCKRCYSHVKICVDRNCGCAVPRELYPYHGAARLRLKIVGLHWDTVIDVGSEDQVQYVVMQRDMKTAGSAIAFALFVEYANCRTSLVLFL
jgi:hypothetical protein